MKKTKNACILKSLQSVLTMLVCDCRNTDCVSRKAVFTTFHIFTKFRYAFNFCSNFKRSKKTDCQKALFLKKFCKKRACGIIL